MGRIKNGGIEHQHIAALGELRQRGVGVGIDVAAEGDAFAFVVDAVHALLESMLMQSAAASNNPGCSH
ncbi:hypothetical protein [Pseudomonas sp. ANT_H12B]|uniref:hypothetical protein n=1 Tax=Pseudomonas sp. ANT_H12B TaxID=2597348 RepID=UPI0015B47ACD|nr:hypothetical protein [Pseudomonas sp. ANT_H12B]